MKTITQILEEFDKEFVKDIGENVEPIFIDAVGSVGPIRAFIKDSLISELKALRDEIVREKVSSNLLNSSEYWAGHNNGVRHCIEVFEKFGIK
jgi:hypothetical protein